MPHSHKHFSQLNHNKRANWPIEPRIYLGLCCRNWSPLLRPIRSRVRVKIYRFRTGQGELRTHFFRAAGPEKFFWALFVAEGRHVVREYGPRPCSPAPVPRPPPPRCHADHSPFAFFDVLLSLTCKMPPQCVTCLCNKCDGLHLHANVHPSSFFGANAKPVRPASR